MPVTLELADVEDAARRLSGVARRTPVLISRTLDERTGARVYVKAECFQCGGAFKLRVANPKVSSLPAASLVNGVLAHSSGNHAQAVAARRPPPRQPRNHPDAGGAPAAKVEATRGYGAETLTYDRWRESREEIGAPLAAERGLELVKP